MKEQGGYDRSAESADQIRRKKKFRDTYRQVIAGVHSSYSITNVVELNGLHCGRLTVSMTVCVTLAHYDS